MKLPGCGELYSDRMFGLGEKDIDELSGGVGTAEETVGDEEWDKDAGARLGDTLKGLLCPNIGAVWPDIESG